MKIGLAEWVAALAVVLAMSAMAASDSESDAPKVTQPR
ncbi:hypothetical protein C7444_108117 [Sphaerotilus hippei]|uniref:Uncharacterized protein n=1 Tax=Sphaerotilus hippei TaxID=744406 RepID=A0A318GZT8_9BURK|nr:hypothetical protein C7444_108117 [Sphaerotilus hippei]